MTPFLATAKVAAVAPTLVINVVIASSDAEPSVTTLELDELLEDELLEDELLATEPAEDTTTGACCWVFVPPPPPPHAAKKMNIGKTLVDLISHLKLIVRILSLYLIFYKPTLQQRYWADRKVNTPSGIYQEKINLLLAFISMC